MSITSTKKLFDGDNRQQSTSLFSIFFLHWRHIFLARKRLSLFGDLMVLSKTSVCGFQTKKKGRSGRAWRAKWCLLHIRGDYKEGERGHRLAIMVLVRAGAVLPRRAMHGWSKKVCTRLPPSPLSLSQTFFFLWVPREGKNPTATTTPTTTAICTTTTATTTTTTSTTIGTAGTCGLQWRNAEAAGRARPWMTSLRATSCARSVAGSSMTSTSTVLAGLREAATSNNNNNKRRGWKRAGSREPTRCCPKPHAPSPQTLASTRRCCSSRARAAACLQMCAARSTWRSVAPSRASVAAIFSGCAQVGLFFPPWRGGPSLFFPQLRWTKKQKSREEKKKKNHTTLAAAARLFFLYASFFSRKKGGWSATAAWRRRRLGFAFGLFLRPACGRRERVAVGRPKGQQEPRKRPGGHTRREVPRDRAAKIEGHCAGRARRFSSLRLQSTGPSRPLFFLQPPSDRKEGARSSKKKGKNIFL